MQKCVLAFQGRVVWPKPYWPYLPLASVKLCIFPGIKEIVTPLTNMIYVVKRQSEQSYLCKDGSPGCRGSPGNKGEIEMEGKQGRKGDNGLSGQEVILEIEDPK